MKLEIKTEEAKKLSIGEKLSIEKLAYETGTDPLLLKVEVRSITMTNEDYSQIRVDKIND